MARRLARHAWGGLGDSLSVRKVKAHTAPEAVCVGVITAGDLAGNDLADAACKLVVSGTPHPVYRASEALGQPGRRMHGSLDRAHWFCEAETLTTFGFLGVGERLLDDARVRDPGPCLCQHLRPSGDEGTRFSIAPGSYGGRVVRQYLLSNCPGAPTLGRLLALRYVLLGFLPGSKRTVHLDCVPVEVLRALSGPCRTRAISFPIRT